MPHDADHHTAMTFEDALERARAGLQAIESDAARERREQALNHLAVYLELLRDATRYAASQPRTSASGERGLWLKLEFADGRWTVAYEPLPRRPAIGDLVELGAGSRWRVRRIQKVRPAPPQAAEREYIVCAEAA